MGDGDAFSFPKLPQPRAQQNALLSGATVTHVSAQGVRTHSQKLSDTSQGPTPRQKAPPAAGYSPMDWLRRVAKRSKDPGVSLVGRSDVPMSEVRQHCTKEDAWTVLRGKVFNVTPYLKFHPGGTEMLMRAAGKDCTALFTKYHAWVNADMLLKADYIGTIDPSTVSSR